MNCLGGLVVYERYIIFWSSLFMRYENSWIFFARARSARAHLLWSSTASVRDMATWYKLMDPSKIDVFLVNFDENHWISMKFHWKFRYFRENWQKVNQFWRCPSICIKWPCRAHSLWSLVAAVARDEFANFHLDTSEKPGLRARLALMKEIHIFFVGLMNYEELWKKNCKLFLESCQLWKIIN